MCIISNSEYTQNVSEIDKLLQQNVGQDLLVRLKNNMTVQGKLKKFDQHLNLSLSNGITNFKEKNEEFEETLLRGSNIMIISFSRYTHSDLEK